MREVSLFLTIKARNCFSSHRPGTNCSNSFPDSRKSDRFCVSSQIRRKMLVHFHCKICSTSSNSTWNFMPFPFTKYFFSSNIFKTFPVENCRKNVLRVEVHQNHAWIGISWFYQMAIKVNDHHKNQSKDFS